MKQNFVKNHASAISLLFQRLGWRRRFCLSFPSSKAKRSCSSMSIPAKTTPQPKLSGSSPAPAPTLLKPAHGLSEPPDPPSKNETLGGSPPPTTTFTTPTIPAARRSPFLPCLPAPIPQTETRCCPEFPEAARPTSPLPPTPRIRPRSPSAAAAEPSPTSG